MTAPEAPWQIDLHALIGRDEIVFDRAALRRAVEGRRIAITGAGGSIGSALAAQLAALGVEFQLLIEHHEDSLFNLRRTSQAWQSPAPARFALVDVKDEDALYRELVTYRPDVIFHLAAAKHVPIGEENPVATVRVNVAGTIAVLDAATASGVSRLVFASTDKAVNPPSVYGATKRLVELILRERRESGGLPRPSVVRLVNTVGAQGGVIRTWVEQALAGNPLTVTDPEMTRYWISMTEALGLLLTALEAERFGPLILAVGDPVNLLEVAKRTWTTVRVDGLPPKVNTMGARPGERRDEYLTRPDERVLPTRHLGVYEVEAVVPWAWPGVLQGARDLLCDLPWDDAALRRDLFALIGEPLGVVEPRPATAGVDA